MSQALTIQGLCKEYPGFQLQNVSFSVEQGTIMGFIGRNGAGKTTTLKAILNLIHPSAGTIAFFGLPLETHEEEIKQRIGYVVGGASYYQRKKLKEIAAVTSSFYPRWDWDSYRRYLKRFSLDEEKKPAELSEGMKVKFHLVLALSHHAELLVLDEPTSGLDPVSRDELLEIFLDLNGEGVGILFSTHITSDLDKCADGVTYIQKGRVLACAPLGEFVDAYRLAGIRGQEKAEQRKAFLGVCRGKGESTALIAKEDAAMFSEEQLSIPNLEDIMVHLEKEKV